MFRIYKSNRYKRMTKNLIKFSSSLMYNKRKYIRISNWLSLTCWMKTINRKTFSTMYSQSKLLSFATHVLNVVHMTISSCAYASLYISALLNASKIISSMLKSVKKSERRKCKSLNWSKIMILHKGSFSWLNKWC